jgi:hypothetical protein
MSNETDFWIKTSPQFVMIASMAEIKMYDDVVNKLSSLIISNKDKRWKYI